MGCSGPSDDWRAPYKALGFVPSEQFLLDHDASAYKGIRALPIWSCDQLWFFMLLQVDDEKRGGQKNLKNKVCFATPFLRQGKGGKEERGQR